MKAFNTGEGGEGVSKKGKVKNTGEEGVNTERR